MASLSKLLSFLLLGKQKTSTQDANASTANINRNAVDKQLQGQPGQEQDTPTPITLESLPAELRHHILSFVLDIEDLKALVLASPVFHQHYLLDRKAFLGRALKATLGNVLVDAYAVHASASLHDDEQPAGRALQHKTAAVRLFMDNYVALRSVSPDQLLTDVEVITTEEEEDRLAAMASFYCSLARPLAEQCAALFLRHLDGDAAASLCVGGSLSLSRTERTRLLRALYRFQLYYNLFGVGPYGYRRPPLDLESSDILGLFFCMFRPWEIEEIDCIYVLIREKYKAVFDAIRSDVARDNPKFEGWRQCWPDTPPGSFDLADEDARVSLRQGTASRGLRLFSKVLQTSDHAKLVKRMQKYIVPVTDCGFIESTLSWSSQYLRRVDHPSGEDRAEVRHELLPFLGDKEDAPPLAWVILWKGKYRNVYGEVIDRRFKAWGYVFWDIGRLKESGGKADLLRDRRRGRPR